MARKKTYKNTAGKEIMKMNLAIDNSQHIYFHDVLFAFMKRSYSKVFMKNASQKGAEILKKAEELSQKKLKKIKKKYLQKTQKDQGYIGKLKVNVNQSKKQVYNPLVTIMFT